MRIPNAQHESGPWRIGEIAADFTLEDAWALPAHGDADDFGDLVAYATTGEPSGTLSLPARALWVARDLLGRIGLGRTSTPGDPGRARRLAIPGSDEVSVIDRLPADLRDTVSGVHFDSLPFTPVYRTSTEFVAELSNRTVHALMHLAWVESSDGTFQGQMGVYAKPRGLLGRAYMAAITPFRLWIVYPALMRLIGQEWQTRRDAGWSAPPSGASPPSP